MHRTRREKAALVRGGCVIHFGFFTAASEARIDTVVPLLGMWRNKSRLTREREKRESTDGYSLFRHRIIRRGTWNQVAAGELH